jgi:hypothetical protein
MLWLGLGSAAYALIGWRWSAPAAAWIAPIFLIRFFRNQRRWYGPLLVLPCLYTAFLVNMIGAWDLPLVAQIILPLIVPLPLVAVLYVDRGLSPYLGTFGSTLVFPAAYVTMDYLLGFTPLGTLFSFGSTQFAFTTIVQTAAVTGIWGISFLIAWFASVVNYAWERRFDLRMHGAAKHGEIGSSVARDDSVRDAAFRGSRAVRSRPGSGAVGFPANPAVIFAAAMLIVLAYGSLRVATSPSEVQTVRVAGITVEHPRNY